MSRVVDERVVSMQFDNRQFERNISQTMSTLEKFNNNMGGLTTAVEAVGKKFTAMEVVAITALTNITNSAINAGKRIVSALTIEPIKTGFNEYELKMGSIQTIMAGTGESLETVNKYLEELNEYSDKTIYSFSDMTQNIGKFTNAGVKLEDAVAAIKGVANVAAISGANSNEASRAMYNFAQALSSGYVKLVDWKSIELANMGTVAFKEQLMDAAVAAGTLTKTADGMYKTLEGHTFNASRGFNDYLQDQWMTTEVLVKTLNDYADETTEIGKKATAAAQEIKTLTMLFDTLKETAQSGWAQTWEVLVGDFEEAKALWTDVNNAISPILESTANARNELLKTWKELGGRTKLIDALRAAFEGIANMSFTLKNAFRDIFEPLKPEQLLGVSEKLLEMATAFKTFTKNAEVMGKIKSLLSGAFSVLKAFGSLIKVTFGGIVNIAKTVKNAFFDIFNNINAGPLLKFSEIIKSFTDRLNTLLKNTEVMDKLGSIAKGIFAVIDIGITVVTALGSALGRLVKYIFPVGDGLVTVGAGIGDSLVALRDWIKSTDIFGKTFGLVADVIIKVIEGFKKALKFIKDCFTNWTGIEVSMSTFTDRFKARLESLGRVFEWFEGAFSSIGSFFSKIGKAISPVVGLVKEGLSTLTKGIGEAVKTATANADFNTLLDVGNAGLLGGILIGVMTFVNKFTKTMKDGDGLIKTAKDFFSKLGKSFSIDGLKNLVKDVLNPVKEALTTWQNSLKADILKKIATAIVILAAALFVLSLIDSKRLTVALAAITGLFIDLFGSMAIFQKVSGKMEFGKLAATLIGVSAAMLILSSAMTKLAKLDWASLGVAVTGMVAMSAMLVGFTAALGYMSKTLVKTEKQTARMSAMVGQLIGLSVAILILAVACRTMAKLSWEGLAKGLIGMTVAVAGLAVALKLMPKSSALSATGLVVAAAALVLLAGALKLVGLLKMDELGRGLFAIGVCLTALAVALKFMQGTIVGSAALLISSVALVAFAGALKLLGLLKWEEVLRGLVAIGGCLTLLAVGLTAMIAALPGAAALVVASAALLLLAPALMLLGGMGLGAIVLSLVAIAGAFTVLGIAGLILTPLIPVILGLAGAITLVGAGCLAAGVAMTLIAAACGVLATVMGTLGVAFVAFGTSVLGLIPVMLSKLGEGIVALVVSIGNGLDTIMGVVQETLIRLIGVLNSTVPHLVATVMNLLITVLEAVNDNMYRITDLGMQIIVNFIQGISDNIQALVEVAIDLVLNFLAGIRSKIPDVIQAGYDLVIDFINGVANAIENNAAPVSKALVNLVKSCVTAAFKSIKTFRTEFKEAGKDLLNGFIEGIKSKITEAANAAKEIGKKALNTIKDFLGIESPSKELFAVGKYFDEGFIKGMNKLSGDVSNSAEDVASGALGSFANVLSGLKDSINDDIDCEPKITPVIDMSKFKVGVSRIKNALGSTGMLSIGTNIAKAQEVSNSVNGNNSGIQNGSVKSAAGNTFSFTQNNYSPKALSRIDIYRQTQNQFANMERMVALND